MCWSKISLKQKISNMRKNRSYHVNYYSLNFFLFKKIIKFRSLTKILQSPLTSILNCYICYLLLLPESVWDFLLQEPLSACLLLSFRCDLIWIHLNLSHTANKVLIGRFLLPVLNCYFFTVQDRKSYITSDPHKSLLKPKNRLTLTTHTHTLANKWKKKNIIVKIKAQTQLVWWNLITLNMKMFKCWNFPNRRRRNRGWLAAGWRLIQAQFVFIQSLHVTFSILVL